MTDQTRSISRLAVALTTLALLGTMAAAGAASAQSDGPAVRVVGNAVTVDDTTTVGVVLTSAPNGLAGYYLDVTVENPDVARISGANYPDRFGLTTDPATGSDGATVTLEAADMEGAIEPGATGVTLATVELAGRAPGTTALTVDPRQFDDDDGGTVDPKTRSDTVTVTAGAGSATIDDGSAGAATAAAADGESGTAANGDVAGGRSDAEAETTTGFGPLPVTLTLVAIGLVALVGVRRRRH